MVSTSLQHISCPTEISSQFNWEIPEARGGWFVSVIPVFPMTSIMPDTKVVAGQYILNDRMNEFQ